MRVYVENVGLVGCRAVVGEDGKTRTYGNIYTDKGELLAFSSDAELHDDLTMGFSGYMDVSWGVGKNGKWFSCRID